MEEVTIKYNIDDIYYLYHTSNRSFYFAQEERFEHISKNEIPFDEDKGTYMYWIDGYGQALLFSKVLEALGYLTHIVFDLYKEPDTFTVVSDYSANWEDHEE